MRLRRLQARSASALGDVEDAQSVLDTLLFLRTSPTRAGMREALHVDLEPATLELRRARFTQAAKTGYRRQQRGGES
jgi:hypothetical protein